MEFARGRDRTARGVRRNRIGGHRHRARLRPSGLGCCFRSHHVAVGSERIPGMVRGIQRMFGSIVGIGIFALLHHFEVGGFWMLTVLAIGQFGAEIFVVKNYALTVIFTTLLR